MKKKLCLLLVILCLLVLAPACKLPEEIASSSIKSLTKPYIATYECTKAMLGEQDLLEKYDYIKITLLDKKQLEVSFKPSNGEKKSFKGSYTVDADTREFTGEIGILGFTFRESTVIERGKFVINKNFLMLPLVMVFEMQ